MLTGDVDGGRRTDDAACGWLASARAHGRTKPLGLDDPSGKDQDGRYQDQQAHEEVSSIVREML